MDFGLIRFPFERVVEINTLILETELGMKGSIKISHAHPDANKRTALAVGLEYLSLIRARLLHPLIVQITLFYHDPTTFHKNIPNYLIIY